MESLYTFTWRRDPIGYEVRKDDEDGELCIYGKSERGETDVYRPFEIGHGRRVLFQIFADIDLDAAPRSYLAFADRFGLLYRGDEEAVFDWKDQIKDMKSSVEAWRRGDIATVCGIFNDHGLRSWTRTHLNLEPPAVPGEKPRLRFRPYDLSAALWIQFAEAVAADLQIRRCGFPTCGTPFAYGPGTGRRSTALYCSPKCQKAHKYQLQLETEK